MLNSVNCSTIICSPTVEYLCSREKPLLKPMAPGSILIISIYITLFTCFVFTLPLLFTLHLSIKNTKNIISIRSHSRKWPWRDWQPLSVGCELLSFCVGTRDLCVVSYWIDTLVLKNWGKYLLCSAASPFPLQGNPTQCSRGSRKISGAVAGESTQKSTYQVPIAIPISRITLFAICLSFSSPPLHPCHFIRPLSLSILPLFPYLPLLLFAFFPYVSLFVFPCAFYLLASLLAKNLLI